TRRERQLEVVPRIVRSRIGREGARGAMLEALVYGQDHELAAARQAPVVHEARQVGERARVVASVPAQDLSYSLAHGRKLSSEMGLVIAGSGSCRGRSPADRSRLPPPGAARSRAARAPPPPPSAPRPGRSPRRSGG